MTARHRIQCNHCSNPDRDGPDVSKAYLKCRFFWFLPEGTRERWNRAGFLYPCAEEREREGLREDAYQDKCGDELREFKRQRFWYRVRCWTWNLVALVALVILIRHGIGHHWVHR
jgi:hypothetical protein